jgi:hypothetical protein
MGWEGRPNMPFSLNPFATAKLVGLRARLSPAECQRRLEAVTLPWTSLMLVAPFVKSSLPLMGWVYPTGFAVRKRFLRYNRLQPEAKAQFVATPDGTRMTVRLGTRRWVTILCFYGLGFAMLFGAGVQFLSPNKSRAFLGALVEIAFFLALGLWLLATQRKSQDQVQFLLDFLKQALEAEEIPSENLGHPTQMSAPTKRSTARR